MDNLPAIAEPAELSLTLCAKCAANPVHSDQDGSIHYCDKKRVLIVRSTASGNLLAMNNVSLAEARMKIAARRAALQPSKPFPMH